MLEFFSYLCDFFNFIFFLQKKLGFPVYGDPHKQGYLEYMAPGVVVSICYIMATGLTSLAFIIERRG